MTRRGFKHAYAIMSYPWALFESKFCIIFSISFSVNVIFDKNLSVLGCRKEGISLPLSMFEHSLAKKGIKQLGFFSEIYNKLFSWKIEHIHGIFLWLFLLSKKRIKQLGFFSEICNKLFSWKIDRIHGIFLSLWKDFSTDQYVLGLAVGSINFLDKREYLSLDASMETPSKFWRDWKFSEYWLLLLLLL